MVCSLNLAHELFLSFLSYPHSAYAPETYDINDIIRPARESFAKKAKKVASRSERHAGA